MFYVRYITYAVLETLADLETESKSAQIADELGISRATFYNQLKILVKTDHVVVKPTSGNRPSRYEITPTGRKALEHGYRRRA